MTDSPGSSAVRERTRPRRVRRLVVGLSFPVVLWCGCSVEKHHDVLSFFFDGVPDPSAAAGGAGGEDGTGPVRLIAHQPFRENLCRACHVSAGSFGFTFSGYSDVEPEVCLKCHEQILEGLVVAHGPVVAMQCVACHEPHESRYPYLLTQPSPALCLHCHDPVMLGDPPTSPHEDLKRDCLECHDGHGGAEPYLLRPTPVPDDTTPAEETPAEEMEHLPAEPWTPDVRPIEGPTRPLPPVRGDGEGAS